MARVGQEILGEAPSHDKATRFAALLRQADERRPLTEELLVQWQNAAVANPLDQAVQFRTEQNRLQRDLPGAAGVTYVPTACSRRCWTPWKPR